MKHFLFAGLMLFSTCCLAQKFVLVDKKMNLPVIYTDTITVQQNLDGYFPVEKISIKEFISEVDKLAKLLAEPKTRKPATIDLLVGNIKIHGIKVPLSAEERMDVVLSTDYGTAKSTMHLSDAKISNAANAYYITTWLKYLRSYIN